ncbi:MAG: hypothetical protein J07HX64_00186 [halophilic archaeon J07HX64]|nr:MAG: hypothetical protein J07HX64_00186 [halophilic archaeon J07HX64]
MAVEPPVTRGGQVLEPVEFAPRGRVRADCSVDPRGVHRTP